MMRLRGRRRGLWIFGGGFLLGLIAAPLLLMAVLSLFVGVNEERAADPAPLTQPDVRVGLSRAYLERSIADNEQFRNPVAELDSHPDGGAALTLTVGFRFPIVGFQDIRAQSRVFAQGGQLRVQLEDAGLGESGGLQLPGNIVEDVLSAIITSEIEKRLNANPAIIIDVVNVSANAEELTVTAALRKPGQ